MPDVIFQPGGRRITVPSGMDLLTASRKAGITREAPCGGRGTCGRCLVHVVTGDYEIVSTGMIPEDIIEEGFVLACKTRVKDTNLVVAVESNFQEEEE